MKHFNTPKDAALFFASKQLAEGYIFITLHHYKDTNGNDIYWRFRLKHPDPNYINGNKCIRPMYRDATDHYYLSEPPFLKDKPKPLYGQELLTQYPYADIWCVEGESCVDLLNQFFKDNNADHLNIAVTSGGSSSAEKAAWEALIDRNVKLWPDNDEAGKTYINVVAEALNYLGCTVKIMDISTLNLPVHGDVADWLENNHNATLEELFAIPTKNIVLNEQGDQLKSNIEWRTPNPIQAALYPVPKFEPEVLLPQPLCDWVMGEAERMPCPPDFIAATALVALCSVVGARCAVRPKSQDNWLIIPNLWGGVVSPPSAKKSPAIAAGFKPFNNLVAKATKQYEQDYELFAAEQTIFEAKKDAYKVAMKKAARDDIKDSTDTLTILVAKYQQFEQEAPPAPVMRRYKSNDTTVEKLGELLQENPSGLLVYRDELVGLLASWERQGHDSDRAFFLEAWNGSESYSTDRIGRGSIFIPNVCVSIFGGIQPDKLTCYLEQASYALANDGMLQRFQVLVYPDHTAWEWRDYKPAKDLQEEVTRTFEILSDFDPIEWGALPPDNSVRFPHFCFTDEAQQIFIEWTSELHTQRVPSEEHFIIQQHLAKYDKLFASIALVLHLVECVSTGARGPISAKAVLHAAAWCEYLEQHARRCYGLLIDDGLRAAQALAEKVHSNKLSDGFTAREVRRNQWRYLTTDDAVQTALDWLEDENWLYAIMSGGAGPGTGRPTKRYLINPAIKHMQKGDNND